MTRSRTGVILAAGLGSRLQGASSETDLKPLTPAAGQPLLLRTVRSLRLAGCDRIIVVVGHGADAVRAALEAADADVEFVHNPRYRLGNGVSVLAAGQALDGDFILTMADHVFSDPVMELARGHAPPPGGASLIVDYDIDGVFDLDDATKVNEHEGRIVDIGKQIPEYNCIDTGLFICTQGLVAALQEVVDERGDASLSEGVARLAAAGRMTVVDIGSGFWRDVDTPEMLAEAEQALAGLGDRDAAAAQRMIT